MESFRYEGIVIDLVRIPTVKKYRRASQSTLHKGNAIRALTARREVPWYGCDRGIRCHSVNSLHRLIIVDIISVETQPHGIDKSGGESVSFLHGHNLPLGECPQ